MEETVGQQSTARKPKCSCKTCRACKMRVYGRNSYEKNKEKVLDRSSANYAANREKRLASQRKHREGPTAKLTAQEWAKNNPEKRRNYQLKRAYGLPHGEYDRLFAAQSGVCARCGKPEIVSSKRTGKVRALSVDHCHNTQQVRSLLCHACNPRIGGRECQMEQLAGDIEYLAQHESPAIEVLVQVLSAVLGTELLALVQPLRIASP